MIFLNGIIDLGYRGVEINPVRKIYSILFPVRLSMVEVSTSCRLARGEHEVRAIGFLIFQNSRRL